MWHCVIAEARKVAMEIVRVPRDGASDSRMIVSSARRDLVSQPTSCSLLGARESSRGRLEAVTKLGTRASLVFAFGSELRSPVRRAVCVGLA